MRSGSHRCSDYVLNKVPDCRGRFQAGHAGCLVNGKLKEFPEDPGFNTSVPRKGLCDKNDTKYIGGPFRRFS